MRLLKIVVEYVCQMLVVAVPLYGSLLAGAPGLGWLADGTKRSVVSVGLFTALFVFEARDAYTTGVGVDEFLRDYVRALDLGIPSEHWGRDLRLNAMYLRRSWWSFFLLPVFEIRGRKGFDAPGVVFADEQLTLLAWQGVAGRARLGEPQYVLNPSGRRTWRIWENFWLLPSQVSRTAKVRAVLSVPMVREARGRRHVIGVLNLDAVSQAGARYIDRNQRQLTLALASFGKLLACLP
jgi:hypothetical protein